MFTILGSLWGKITNDDVNIYKFSSPHQLKVSFYGCNVKKKITLSVSISTNP